MYRPRKKQHGGNKFKVGSNHQRGGKNKYRVGSNHQHGGKRKKQRGGKRKKQRGGILWMRNHDIHRKPYQSGGMINRKRYARGRLPFNNMNRADTIVHP